jgi:hypothetical protein
MKRLLLVICVLTMGSLARAQTPSLGAAATFAVLGSTNVTCTAPGVITGDVGVSPGAFTNTTGCLVVGTVHQGLDLAAAMGLTAFLNTYNALALTPCTQTISTAAFTGNVPAMLGPFPLTSIPPGVYCFPAAVTFTDTTLTLDGSTNPTGNGIWIFKVGAALTGTGFQVVMAGGGQPCNVFWLPGAASTFTTSTVQGNILAGGPAGSITVTGGNLIGRVLARVAVTLTGANIHGTCALVAQGGAGCKNDDDDGDKDHDRDKDKDRDRHEKDKDGHDKDKDRDEHKDH